MTIEQIFFIAGAVVTVIQLGIWTVLVVHRARAWLTRRNTKLVRADLVGPAPDETIFPELPTESSVASVVEGEPPRLTAIDLDR